MLKQIPSLFNLKSYKSVYGLVSSYIENEKFHKSSEIKKNLTQTKINQMKESAIKEIKDRSIKIALESVKKIMTTTVDKSKLDNLFEKNLEEAKSELKKINS